MKEEVEKHMEELVDELDKVDNEMSVLRDDQTKNLDQLQKKYSLKIQGLVEKSEKLAAENFEYAVENVRFKIIIHVSFHDLYFQEQLEKQFRVLSGSRKTLEKELTQLRVENQWLVGNNKKSNGNGEKVEDMARELQEIKLELRNEKEKVYYIIHHKFILVYNLQVKNLVDWKSQLAEKNKSLQDENNR